MIEKLNLGGLNTPKNPMAFALGLKINEIIDLLEQPGKEECKHVWVTSDFKIHCTHCYLHKDQAQPDMDQLINDIMCDLVDCFEKSDAKDKDFDKFKKLLKKKLNAQG